MHPKKVRRIYYYSLAIMIFTAIIVGVLRNRFPIENYFLLPLMMASWITGLFCVFVGGKCPSCGKRIAMPRRGADYKKCPRCYHYHG